MLYLLNRFTIRFPGNFTDKIRYPCEHNITDPVNYKCMGNQGAQLVYHMVQRRLWTYARLPIEGLKSVVIHGNSPTMCIGAGNEQDAVINTNTAIAQCLRSICVPMWCAVQLCFVFDFF